MKRWPGIGLILLTLCCFTGCRTAYYSAWEKLGKDKRDLLKETVQKARNDQEKATEQFKDALTRLRELYNIQGGELEKFYDRLKADFDRSVSRSDTVKSRIRKVEEIASDLFTEWEAEIKSISNPRLQTDSRKKLGETRQRYESLHEAMKRAERKMDPVLRQFRDQVLYLKHNLNAQAIGALKTEVVDIEREIQQLIQEMSRAVEEADSFLKTLP
jgi:hypothetical protein